MITVPSVTRVNLAVVLVAVLASCQNPIDTSHWATGRFQGDKVISLNARYDASSAALTISAYADVPDGATAVLELTGPEHWRCDGGFRQHPSATTFAGDNQNLPYFVAGGATYSTVNFFVPAGSYTATIQIPGFHASLDERVKLDHGSAPDADTGLEQQDPGCVRVADSAAQQKDLIGNYIRGIQLIVKRLGKSDLRTIADKAQQALMRANALSDPAVIRSANLSAARILRTLGDAARAEFPNPPSSLMQAIDDAVALLSQSGLR